MALAAPCGSLQLNGFLCMCQIFRSDVTNSLEFQKKLPLNMTSSLKSVSIRDKPMDSEASFDFNVSFVFNLVTPKRQEPKSPQNDDFVENINVGNLAGTLWYLHNEACDPSG